MRRLVLAFALLALAVAVQSSPLAAKVPNPVPRETAVPGEYRGHVSTEYFPTLSRGSALSFVYRNGEVRGFKGALGMGCGSKELSEGPEVFAQEIGSELHGSVTPKGIFLATEHTVVATAETPSGAGMVRVRLRGWFDGEESRGTYWINASDGSSCLGTGRWHASRVRG